MYKLIITLILSLSFHNVATSLTLGDIKKTTDIGAQRFHNTYVMGVGQGIFWSNVLLEMRGKQKMFCPPKDLVFTGQYFLNLLEDVKKDTAYTGREGTEIEIVIFLELEKKYKCENRQVQDKNTEAPKALVCSDIAAVVNKQLPKKINEIHTVKSIKCIDNGNRTAIIYNNELNLPDISENLLTDRFKLLQSEIKKTILTNNCKDPNMSLMARNWQIRYDYVSPMGFKIGEIYFNPDDCKFVKE